MPRPLIDVRGRRPALIAIAVALAVVVTLAAVVWHGTTTRFDTWAFVRAYRDFGATDSDERRFWLIFTEPVVSFAVPIAVLLWGVATRQWRVAALAALGSPLALGVTELIGKPLVDRVIGPEVLFGNLAGSVHGSFPSGHETGLVSWLVIVVVLVVRSQPRRRVVVGTLVLAVLVALAGAVGMTVNYFHYATDAIGAIGVAVAVVLTVGLTIDAVSARVGRRLS